MGRKFDWSRIDQIRSVAETNGIEMRVECDSGLPCEWTVRGFARERNAAIARSEEAALATIPGPRMDDEQFDELFRLATTGEAYLIVKGQRDSFTLLNLLRRARNTARK